MNTRLWSAVGGAIGLAVVAAGCGSASSSESSNGGGDYQVIVLGGIGAEGALADNASTSVLAAKAGVEAVNEAGGIDGREVSIEVIDDQADPTVAVTKLREAIAQDKPDLVLNSGPSTVADATLPILTQNKILSFNIGPTEISSNPESFPYNFDLATSLDDQTGAFIPHFEENGYEKIGILHGSSSSGEAFGDAAEANYDEAGFDVVANEEYDIAALDMTAQLEAIKSEEPDVLVLNAYGAPLGYVLKGVEKLGWSVPIVGDLSVSATGLIATEPPAGVLGTSVVENLVTQVFKSTAYDPEATDVVEVVDRMAAIDDIRATLILAYNYDALQLVAAAAEHAGSTDTEALAEALVEPEVQEQAATAILPQYNFTTESHSSQPGAEGFAFIPPSPIKNGQFQ